MKLRDFSFRIEDELLKKLHYVADYEDRSVNRELLRLVKRHIEEFECKHGEIKISDND